MVSSAGFMTETDSLALSPPSLRPALERRGFTSLTPVQEAVVASSDGGRDLRVTSQTGSGKTVAYGMAVLINALGTPETRPSKKLLADELDEDRKRPIRVIVLVPTRELAQQVCNELRWLYEDVNLKVHAVYGGTSVRDDLRMLSGQVDVLVATPGRICDHVRNGNVKLARVRALVLDEADEMLAMGFREELDELVAALPSSRRTVLVSATFPRAVMDLVARIQRDPVLVRGTDGSTSHADIEHVIHMVHSGDRDNAVINVLLMQPDTTSLLFVKTREGANDVASGLGNMGFSVELLSGEMDQRARTRALASFKEGRVKILVATDVAARGLDVQDIGRVIHVDPPDDPDSYTHRSGRTGRAGRKGESIIIIPPGKRPRVVATLERARAPFVYRPVPTAADVAAANQKRLIEAVATSTEEDVSDDSTDSAVEELLAHTPAKDLVKRLFARLAERERITEPRKVTPITPPAPRSRPRDVARDENGRADRGADRFERPERPARGDRGPDGEDGYAQFHVTYGTKHGATKQRMLALVCRRGDITSSDVGAIRLGMAATVVEVRNTVAAHFLELAGEPDERDARVSITPFVAQAGDRGPREDRPRPPYKPRTEGRPYAKPYGERAGGDRPAYAGDRPAYGGGGGDRPAYRDKPAYAGGGDKPAYADRGDKPAYTGGGDKTGYPSGPRGDKPAYPAAPRADKPGYPRGDKPGYPRGDKPAPAPRAEYAPRADGDKPAPKKTPYAGGGKTRPKRR